MHARAPMVLLLASLGATYSPGQTYISPHSSGMETAHTTLMMSVPPAIEPIFQPIEPEPVSCLRDDGIIQRPTDAD